MAKRFRGRGCGFLDLQASREALSFDPALGEPLEIIVDGVGDRGRRCFGILLLSTQGARAVLKPVHLGDVVRVEGFIQETRRPGAMAVRLDNSGDSLEIIQPWTGLKPFVGRKLSGCV